MEDFIGKDQKFVTNRLVREGLDKIVEVLKGVSSRFYALSHCLSSYNLSYHTVYTLKRDRERST